MTLSLATTLPHSASARLWANRDAVTAIGDAAASSSTRDLVALARTDQTNFHTLLPLICNHILYSDLVANVKSTVSHPFHRLSRLVCNQAR